jgi:hypothetical protein|tara:strand:+ start:730 stop:1728 length:999 start_codon:yes stop_codon:yes gene_type:complete
MTTDLETLAESLVVTETAEEAVDENQLDADESEVEETEAETDVEVDDADASDSDSDDDVEEYDDAGAEDEDADDDADEAPVETQLHTVIVDGKEQQWTLEQLKQSASGQSAINQRFQENAAQRKELEQHKAQLEQREAEILNAFEALQSGQNLTPPTPPDVSLSKTDPIGYMQADAEYRQKQFEYQQNVQRFQAIQQQKQARQQAQSAEERQMAEMRLSQQIPEYADPATRDAFAQGIFKVGEELGFSKDEMMGLTDDRMIVALHKVAQFNEMQAKRQAAKSKVKKAADKKPMKAGVKKAVNTASAARKKAQARLRQTGSIDDAVSLIFKGE